MTDEPRVERLRSGVPGLDVILHGGFIERGIYLIQGAAGSGKTIFGNQLCCHRVREGGRALYVSLLSESIDRMLLNIGGLEFFDPNVVAHTLNYVSALPAFEAEGWKGVLELIRRELRSRGADLLVLDGLGSADEPVGASTSLGEFTHQLQAQNSLLGCTTFLLARGLSLASSERTVVDGVIELHTERAGARRERRLELSVFRGSENLPGEHAFEIGPRGLRVYPRLEAVLARPTELRALPAQTVPSGIAGLDHALGEEGLPAASAALCVGPSGSGKTAFALHFLASCEPGKRGVYLSFAQGDTLSRDRARRIGVQLDAQLDTGAVQWLWRPPREHIIDAIGHELLELSADPSVARIVIDGLDAFEQCALDRARLLPFLAALLDTLRARGITTLCTAASASELSPDPALEFAGGALPSLFETWIALGRFVQHSGFKRTLSVLKAPANGEVSIGELSIGSDGMRVGPLSAFPLSSLTESSELDPPMFMAKATSAKPAARPKSVRRK